MSCSCQALVGVLTVGMGIECVGLVPHGAHGVVSLCMGPSKHAGSLFPFFHVGLLSPWSVQGLCPHQACGVGVPGVCVGLVSPSSMEGHTVSSFCVELLPPWCVRGLESPLSMWD